MRTTIRQRRALALALLRARHVAGMTQSEVALALGHRSTGTISNYERGAREPGAIQLARLYGVRVDSLLEGVKT